MKIVSGKNIGEITMDELKSNKTILFFYPKANTPGWVVEAGDFSRLKSEFEKKGYTVIGASRDSASAQQKFIEKRELSVDLIADTESELCNYFGVIKEKNVFGKIGLGIVRTTLVLDKDFEVIKRYDNVKVSGHAQTVLDELE